MQVVYAREPFPDRWTKSVFLAGPTPRKGGPPSWRPEALRILEAAGYDGVVFVPEDRDMNGCVMNPENYDAQILWENEGLNRADAILFWVPRDLAIDLPEDLPPGTKTLDVKDLLKFPAFTTNVEWGKWFDSGKVALGYPKDAPKMGYLKAEATLVRAPVAKTLEETARAALGLIGEGALREGGETHVPIDVWRTPIFQRWHSAQKAAGNRLLSADVQWTYRIGRERERLLFWTLETQMYVAAEKRVVKDGLVIGRPDVSVTILLGPDHGYNTEIVLIREFRPSAVTSDGYVREPPGGSSWEDLTPVEIAAAEVAEEAGIVLTHSRFKPLAERQLLATLCPHRANVFVARLTKEELQKLRALQGRPLGRERDRERTWVEFTTFRDLFEAKEARSRDVDYATLGMLYSAFYMLA